jgi:ABC-type transport system involved in cytochrome bd biosynthesis fused ATPase/permease subunit
VSTTVLFVGAPFLLVYSASVAVRGLTLAVLLTVIELVAFARSPLRYLERIEGHDLGLNSVTAWRRWLIVTVGEWPYRRLAQASTGDLLERALADTDSLQDLWLRAIVPLLAVGSATLAGDVVVATLRGPSLSSGAAAGVLLGCQLVGVGAILAYLPRLLAGEREVRATRAARTAARISWQPVAPLLDLLGRPSAVVRRFDDLAGPVRRAESRRDAVVRNLRLLSVLAPLVTLVVVVRAGLGSSPLRGRTDLLVALIAMSSVELYAVATSSVVVATRVLAAADRLDELEGTSVGARNAVPTSGELVVTGLDVVVGDRTLIEDATFTVPSGRHLGIRGPTGSGKSTLLRLVAGLDRPTGGAVQLGGVGIDEIEDHDLHQRIAWVGDDPGFLRGPVATTLRAGRSAVEDLAPELAGLGLAVPEDGRWAGRSRGEALRAGLVRGLLGRPAVLIVDEPTSGLGGDDRDRVIHRLRQFSGTLVVASHDEGLLGTCDEILEIRHGTLDRPASHSPRS